MFGPTRFSPDRGMAFPSRANWGGAVKSYLGSTTHKTGMRMLGEMYGIGQYKGKGMAKWLGRGFLGFSAIQGYAEGGFAGAMKNVAGDLAVNYAIGAVLGSLATPLAAAGIGLGVAATAGAAYGLSTGLIHSPAQFVRPWVYEHMKKHTSLEMGTPTLDQFGTAATMRQRSLEAINNSRFNGRTALGQEAALMYSPYYR